MEEPGVLYHCSINEGYTISLCGIKNTTTIGIIKGTMHICLRPEFWKDDYIKCQNCINHEDYPLLLLASI